MNNKTLTELADYYISDKGMMRPAHHGYTFVYEMLFQNLKERRISLLELGLARTSEDFRGRAELRSCQLSPSVAMWLDYFPDAHVTGFDLSDFSDHRDSRFTFVQGDLGKPEDYDRLLAECDRFDIIVDDGSHASLHQMLAFAHLFPALKDGGFFVIEDTWRQPPAIEKQNPTSHTVSRLFREFLQLGYFPQTTPVDSSAFNALIDQIGGVLFIPYHNAQGASDQLVVVHKKDASLFHLYRSKIRFFKSQPSEDDRASLLEHTRISLSNPYPLYHLALLELDNNELDMALEYADKAFALSVDDAQIILLRARVLARMKKHTEALDFAVEHMAEPVGSDVIAVSLAQEFIGQKEYELADKLLDRHLQIAPDSSRGHFLSGRCRELSGDLPSAARFFEHAFDILPSKFQYLEACARITCKQKDPGVIDYLLGVESDFSDDPNFVILLANTYLQFGRREQAIATARSLLGTSKDSWARDFLDRFNPLKRLIRKLAGRF